MPFRIMLRERGTDKWTAHNGAFDKIEEARVEAQATVNNSGFDGLQIWSLVEQQEHILHFVTTVGGEAACRNNQQG